MGTFWKRVGILIIGLSYSCNLLARSGDCVDCSVGGDQSNVSDRPAFRMERIKCIENDDPRTFDRNFCSSIGWFVDKEDFLARIEKCKEVDPKGRKTILDFFKTLDCESRYIEEFHLFFVPNNGRTTSTPTTILFDSDRVIETSDFLRNIMKEYRDMGKDNGYKELKEFVSVLNRQDDNGKTFLDNVLCRFRDKMCEEDERFENIRIRLIKNMCKVGGKFSDPKDMQRFNCNADTKYTN